jgi:lysophospholipase L1-like esterase
VTYVDITAISRRGLEQPDLVAADGLHPSGEMYGKWVEKILATVLLK